MKKVLLMIAAALLLMTQCRKDEMPAVMPETNTVKMTVTVGSGSKTDIADNGTITWSENDKLYVGNGSKCIGCLDIEPSDIGQATAKFSGNVDLTGITDGTEQTFHFYYLGRAERTLSADATTVDVDFSSQDGSLANASAQHVGYGSASGTVKGGIVTGINVTLVSKVALARFSFTKGGEAYDGALTLSGTNIFNKMTVDFSSSTGFSFSGTEGDIDLGSGNAERYVMLVPTGTGDVALSFASGGKTGVATIEGGIHENKFYGMKDAIAVTLETKFTVGMDGVTPRTVEFAPGNLWYGRADDEETAAFHFEANQWGTDPTSEDQWNPFHVSHFKWSDDALNAVTGDEEFSGNLFFCASNFTVAGDSHTDWRTLSVDEWRYLLGPYGGALSRKNASDLRAWVTLTDEKDEKVSGLVILPDGTENPSTVMDGITSTADLATSGAVFLPAAGDRYYDMIVYEVGSFGYYWSSTLYEENVEYAYEMHFCSYDENVIDIVGTTNEGREFGFSVRLVR